MLSALLIKLFNAHLHPQGGAIEKVMAVEQVY